MGFFDEPIRGGAAPLGIVSFELAGTPERAAAILDQWAASDAIEAAWWGTWVDYIYLVIYGAFFAALCAWVGARAGEDRWRPRAVWAATIAPLFDAAENVCLLVQIRTLNTATPLPELAAGYAAVKFALLFACLLYVLAAAASAAGKSSS